MEKLLESWNLYALLPGLQAAGVNDTNLIYLTDRDICDIFKEDIGKRAEFRSKLFEWQKQQRSINFSDCGNSQPRVSIFYKKTLLEVLSETDAGNVIKSFYNENKRLTENTRERLVDIIISKVAANNCKLSPNDFHAILLEIIETFPEEEQFSDYYYIPRRQGKAPSGKLFSKFKSISQKRRKLDVLENKENAKECNTTNSECPVDETLQQLKQELNWPLSEWSDQLDRWARTFSLRQRDLRNLSNEEFLIEWPLLKDARATDLIQIDFDILYPSKGKKLFEKWINFKDIVVRYYSSKSLNPRCKNVLKEALDTSDINCLNKALLILINSVIPSKGYGGRQYSLLDAEEFLILDIVSINNLDIKLRELEKKCQSLKLTLQPLVVAEGVAKKTFYVSFDNILFKFESLLEAFDYAFKLMQVLNLKYPDPCLLTWTFVQNFFYEIETSSDARSAALTLFINYFKK